MPQTRDGDLCCLNDNIGPRKKKLTLIHHLTQKPPNLIKFFNTRNLNLIHCFNRWYRKVINQVETVMWPDVSLIWTKTVRWSFDWQVLTVVNPSLVGVLVRRLVTQCIVVVERIRLRRHVVRLRILSILKPRVPRHIVTRMTTELARLLVLLLTMLSRSALRPWPGTYVSFLCC